jgi:hypothetical protein
MKHLIVSLTTGACLLVASAGMTLAGQPGTNNNVNCNQGSATNIPGGSTGGAATTSQSPFNPSGKSGGVYANAFNQSGSQNTTNPHATSQYDIACLNSQVP